jgi:hypothetical protein
MLGFIRSPSIAAVARLKALCVIYGRWKEGCRWGLECDFMSPEILLALRARR